MIHLPTVWGGCALGERWGWMEPRHVEEGLIRRLIPQSLHQSVSGTFHNPQWLISLSVCFSVGQWGKSCREGRLWGDWGWSHYVHSLGGSCETNEKTKSQRLKASNTKNIATVKNVTVNSYSFIMLKSPTGQTQKVHGKCTKTVRERDGAIVRERDGGYTTHTHSLGGAEHT